MKYSDGTAGAARRAQVGGKPGTTERSDSPLTPLNQVPYPAGGGPHRRRRRTRKEEEEEEEEGGIETHRNQTDPPVTSGSEPDEGCPAVPPDWI
ncbi:unnamed protein product [Pleuronectes platessa]|uniref:Uncharacterized protein n=1 Tax=Pleuronectes platessa TaxID=8262 RepID=A0A9N7ZBF1_PLEPL|nr:unnamed protein product [Pleuronectes platessa]